MPVLDVQSLMLPVLRALSNEDRLSVAEVCTRVADAEGLTADDRSERTKGGYATKLKDRVTWTITYFGTAGLVERVDRGVYRITHEHRQFRQLLARDPARTDLKLLRDYPLADIDRYLTWNDEAAIHVGRCKRMRDAWWMSSVRENAQTTS